jgi:hypothetical protein
MDSDTSPGRCPGLVCSAPLARHRACVLKMRNWCETIWRATLKFVLFILERQYQYELAGARYEQVT